MALCRLLTHTYEVGSDSLTRGKVYVPATETETERGREPHGNGGKGQYAIQRGRVRERTEGGAEEERRSKGHVTFGLHRACACAHRVHTGCLSLNQGCIQAV